MKKTSLLLITALTIGCSPSREQMAKDIDQLSSQVKDLTTENHDLKQVQAKQSRQLELLCGLYGEVQTQGMLQYLGNETFVSVADKEIHKFEGMVDKCLEMTDSYDEMVSKRAQNLLKKEK